MIHPQTELRHVDDVIGLGVFATALIPRGTIVWVLDELDQRLTPERVAALGPDYGPHLERYAYTSGNGDRVLCWDAGRFVNHGCDATCLSPGFEFEIAVRDIHPGEELLDDYGSLNLEGDFPCSCRSPRCRGVIRPDDMTRLAGEWDARLQPAFRRLAQVRQPLWSWVREKDAVAQALREPAALPSIGVHRFAGAALPTG